MISRSWIDARQTSHVCQHMCSRYDVSSRLDRGLHDVGLIKVNWPPSSPQNPPLRGKNEQKQKFTIIKNTYLTLFFNILPLWSSVSRSFSLTVLRCVSKFCLFDMIDIWHCCFKILPLQHCFKICLFDRVDNLHENVAFYRSLFITKICLLDIVFQNIASLKLYFKILPPWHCASDVAYLTLDFKNLPPC
jgi:hypothetical protein